jgi:phosphoglycerate dehydrogenase-like enzyme
MTKGNPRASRPTVALAMSERTRRDLLPPRLVQRLGAVADVDPDHLVQDFHDHRHAECLARAEVLLTGWGAPAIDDAALAAMPRLRAVVHGAGSVKGLVDRRVFDRGVLVSSAATANAVPVAEFTLAAIIFAAKRVTRFARLYQQNRSAGALELPVTGVGGYRLTVGVVGASRIGRRVLGLLRNLDMHALVSDPYLDAAGAAELGAEWVEPDELVRRSDIVTLHAPDVPATRHLIDRRRLAMMRDGATLINTARGRLVDTVALTPELVSGRLDAVLDVTDPEPLPADSPLFDLPNVLLTPHVAGALGNEVARLGELAVCEIERLAAGLPPAHPVRLQDLDRIA